MPRSERPLDNEWVQLQTTAVCYLDTVERSGTTSAEANDAFLNLLAEINSFRDILAIRAQGMACPDIETLQRFQTELESLHDQIEERSAWRALKERIRRELQPHRHKPDPSSKNAA
jgi:hypothetical protein